MSATKEMVKKDKTQVQNSSAEQFENSGVAYRPDVDIIVSDNDAVLYADLPGVKKGDITIEINENDVLTIKAETKIEEPQKNIVKQFSIGNYYRAFQLSEHYDKENVKVEYENGVLKVIVPKKEEAKPKKIEIKA